MTVDELYDDLCETKEQAEAESARALPEGADMTSVLATGVPWVVTIVGRWIARKFVEETCDHKDDIKAAVDKFLDRWVKNEDIQQMILAAYDAAMHTACG